MTEIQYDFSFICFCFSRQSLYLWDKSTPSRCTYKSSSETHFLSKSTLNLSSIINEKSLFKRSRQNSDFAKNRFNRVEHQHSFHTVAENVLYIYSAYYDDRQPHDHKFGLVRLFGLYNAEKLNATSTIRCRLRYRSSDGLDSTEVRSTTKLQYMVEQ